jgi:hypothetical protein
MTGARATGQGMTGLSRDAQLLLAIIARRGGSDSWYRIGRVHLHEFSSPPAFDQACTELLEAGLVHEASGEILLTETGSIASAGMQQLSTPPPA